MDAHIVRTEVVHLVLSRSEADKLVDLVREQIRQGKAATEAYAEFLSDLAECLDDQLEQMEG